MRTKPTNSNPTKTVLIIVLGLLIVGAVSKWHGWINIAILLGVICAFSDYLTKKVDFLWMKLAWLLGLIVPNILLSIVFYVFLTPIAWLSRQGNKDPLLLKNTKTSIFKEYRKSFNKTFFEKPW
ncbi:hypothetical protein FACS189415_1840 [Bacteroidia bacterium]|nr:hypothetical protein FACS189415_1840 [Bacteroidia bacterium]